jgi:carboxypeptidase T
MIVSTIIAEQYRRITIPLDAYKQLIALPGACGIAPEDAVHSSEGVELTVDSSAYRAIVKQGFAFNIACNDVVAENRLGLRRGKMCAAPPPGAPIGFGFGSMGGYHTFDEAVAIFDSLHAHYPALISAKKSIGKTCEQRDVWAVKISDNPDLDEAATEPAVYIDALIHSREVITVEAMLYYVYWLLENYQTDPLARYLIDNREIYLVPVVNADGLVYNERKVPGGGGMWRKNRRDNGNGAYGVDLNRNFSTGFGLENGSSGDPSLDTYRGTAAFSEPEARALRDFISAIKPKTACLLHSVAGHYLIPYTYNDENPHYNYYAEFTPLFSAANQYLYGSCKGMLDYYSSGTTLDWVSDQGCVVWLPEIGPGADFWPPQADILSIAADQLTMLQTITHLAGAYVSLLDMTINDGAGVGGGEAGQISLTLVNRGLGSEAKKVVLSARSLSSGVTMTKDSANLAPIASRRTIRENNALAFTLAGTIPAASMESIEITASHDGCISAVDTLRFVTGRRRVLWADSAESGIDAWQRMTRSGTGLWDTSSAASFDGASSFADSRYGNTANNYSATASLVAKVSLAGTVHPRLECAVKYACEKSADYASIQISENAGASWTTLRSACSGVKGYTGVNDWVRESFDLSAYIGSAVSIRMTSTTDAQRPGDGIYVDALRIVDHADYSTSIAFALNNGSRASGSIIGGNGIRVSGLHPGSYRIRVCDVRGRVISEVTMTEDGKGIRYDNNDVAPGVYLVRVTGGSGEFMGKVGVVK